MNNKFVTNNYIMLGIYINIPIKTTKSASIFPFSLWSICCRWCSRKGDIYFVDPFSTFRILYNKSRAYYCVVKCSWRPLHEINVLRSSHIPKDFNETKRMDDCIIYIKVMLSLSITLPLNWNEFIPCGLMMETRILIPCTSSCTTIWNNS